MSIREHNNKLHLYLGEFNNKHWGLITIVEDIDMTAPLPASIHFTVRPVAIWLRALAGKARKKSAK